MSRAGGARPVRGVRLVSRAGGARPVRAALAGPAVLATLTVLGLLLGGIALPGAAFAHNVLSGSDPADGANLDDPPARISLTFNQPVQPSFNTVTVVGPDGAQFGDGAARVKGDTVELSVRPLGPAGRYTIGYRVISDDGHPVTGSIGFSLTRPGPGQGTPPAAATPGAPAAAPGTGPSTAAGPSAVAAPATAGAEPPAPDGGMPAWPWIAGAVVLAGAGAALALRAGRG